MTTQATPTPGLNDSISTETFAEIMHELCVPLSSVGTAVDLLLKDDESLDPSDATRLLHRVRDGTRWMQDLVSDLAAAAPETRRDGPFNLGHTIERAARVVQPLFQARRLSLHVSLPPRPVVVWGYEHLIRRASLNLLTNAAKYAPDGDAVRVQLKLDSEAARVEVVDHGTELASENIERLFEPRTRSLVHVQEQLPGQGIGLSVVKSLVEEHGGHVGARVRRNRSTVFWFSLPRLGSRGRHRLH